MLFQVVLEELLPNHQAVFSGRDVPVVLDSPVDVQVPVEVSLRSIKLYGADRACVRIYPIVFLLKKGITKSPCPQVISLEWGLVSGRRLFYLLVDQSKDKV